MPRKFDNASNKRKKIKELFLIGGAGSGGENQGADIQQKFCMCSTCLALPSCSTLLLALREEAFWKVNLHHTREVYYGS